MVGVTLSSRDTALLADVVSACEVPDGAPVPWRALEQIKELVHADELSFSGFDTLLPHVWFAQGIDAEGFSDVDGETPAEATENDFWDGYWLKECSYPDRTGDYVSVTKASDFASLARIRSGHPSGWPDHALRACLPSPDVGRHYRLVAWRFTGSDFTERERFLLALLRPHLAQAYAASVSARRLPPPLTRRQLEILRMVQHGFTNLQIGHRLHLSEATVRTHLNNIYQRLGVHGRGAAGDAVFASSEVWTLTR